MEVSNDYVIFLPNSMKYRNIHMTTDSTPILYPKYVHYQITAANARKYQKGFQIYRKKDIGHIIGSKIAEHIYSVYVPSDAQINKLSWISYVDKIVLKQHFTIKEFIDSLTLDEITNIIHHAAPYDILEFDTTRESMLSKATLEFWHQPNSENYITRQIQYQTIHDEYIGFCESDSDDE